MKPTVGRIVWYTPQEWEPEDGPLAALITYVSTIESTDGMPLVNLAIFGPEPFGKDSDASRLAVVGGMKGVSYSGTPKPGCWSWPPRAP